MFGSNFFGQFGIPEFPFGGVDPQGGMFGQQPMQQPTDQFGQPPQDQQPVAPPAAQPAAPAALGNASPLALGKAPGTQPQQQAPAAGIGSPLAKTGV